MNFAEALAELKKGKMIRRDSWQDQEVYAVFKPNVPKVKLADGNVEIDYEPTEHDLVADDWISMEGG